MAPALRAMPWLLALGSAATYLASRLDAHSYDAFRFAFSAWASKNPGQCLLLPANLLYPHLLWTLSLPARLAGRLPDTLLTGQVLGALSAALAVALFYVRARAAVADWRTALLAALFLAASFAVWLCAVEAAPQAPALALGMGALILAWPARGRAGLGRLGLAGLLAAAASVLDLGASLWLVPLGAAAALESPKAERRRRVAVVAFPAALILAAAYWLAWRRVQSAGLMAEPSQWLALLQPKGPQAAGALRVFLYFKTFKFALLYRTPWFVGLPLTLGFAGLARAWRREPRPVIVFGLWAVGGAVRAVSIDPAQTQVWALAMPGVMGLFACSLDSGLAIPRLRRLRVGALLVGALTLFVFVGNIHGWLPRFELLAGYGETDQAARRLAELSDSPEDLFLAPQGFFGFVLPYSHGRPWVLEPSGIRQSAAAQGRDVPAWASEAVGAALRQGKSVFVHKDYLDPESPLYASQTLPPELADCLAAALGGPGEAPGGFKEPYVFRLWRGVQRNASLRP